MRTLVVRRSCAVWRATSARMRTPVLGRGVVDRGAAGKTSRGDDARSASPSAPAEADVTLAEGFDLPRAGSGEKLELCFH